MKRAITVRISVSVVLVILALVTWFKNGYLDLGGLRFFSIAVLSTTIILWLWDFWLWRFPLIQRLPGVPRSVRGTWKGTLISYWVNPETGGRLPPKIVYLVVHQTASLVSAKLYTDESKSTSVLAKISMDDGDPVLVYLYLNRPDIRVENRSRMHHGSVALDISGCPAARLRGHYWTDRDSKGELEFNHRCKRLADDFSTAAGYFETYGPDAGS